MDCATYLSSLSFTFVQPEDGRHDGWYELARAGREPAKVLDLPFAPLDICNTTLPEPQWPMREALRDLCEVQRMSTLAIGGLINHAVAHMPEDRAYVNVGVWHGFTFLAGMLGNPRRACVGIDNFSDFGGPRERFMGRFEELKGPAHAFYEMDYREYFEQLHREPIGVYLYDGNHEYENQQRGLEIAEPYFADGCIVLVDDTNWQPPRDATIDFVAESEREYELLLDCTTPDHPHPTFWNGLMVFQVTGRPRSRPADEIRSNFPPREPGEQFPRPRPSQRVEGTPLINIVLVHDRSPASLGAAVEACLAQTWPRVEVIVVDRGAGAHSGEAPSPHEGRVARVPAKDLSAAAGIAEALALTTGEFVAFADTAVPLRESAVHVALCFPDRVRQLASVMGDGRYAELEAALS
jgi:Methyltransferase domain/Glycosyl transferase family 2